MRHRHISTTGGGDNLTLTTREDDLDTRVRPDYPATQPTRENNVAPALDPTTLQRWVNWGTSSLVR
jgi:hypothetical protein